jgi:hypothetical protein
VQVLDSSDTAECEVSSLRRMGDNRVIFSFEIVAVLVIDVE